MDMKYEQLPHDELARRLREADKEIMRLVGQLEREQAKLRELKQGSAVSSSPDPR